jgi:hypothetical protein
MDQPRSRAPRCLRCVRDWPAYLATEEASFRQKRQQGVTVQPRIEMH